MNPERWRRIDDLFDAATLVDPSARGDWLRRECGDDDDLRAEVGHLLAQDEHATRDGFLTPPEVRRLPEDSTASWPLRDDRHPRPTPALDAPRTDSTDLDDDSSGFTPKAVIAEGVGSQSLSETRSLVRARLRELPFIYILIFGMAVFWKNVIVRDYDRTISSVNALLIVALAALAALLLSRRPLSLVQLRSLEVGMFAMIGSKIVYTQYRLMLVYSLREDAISAQRVMQNTVLLTSILILTCGIYVPKTWRRAAMLAGPLALLPFATLLVLYLLHPEAQGLLGKGWQLSGATPLALYSFDAMLLLILGVGSAYGAHTISRLRREVVEARQLGQYRLRHRIGSGGMGEVYLAEHRLLKRPCAVKLIRQGDAADPRALERFEREVRITATLSHPNTVEIYDYGRTEDGTYYYVMEYLPGLSLAELVKCHGPVPAERTIYLLRQVALALREAHAAGLIHRDIKPSNIFAARRGGMDDVAKLLDFGLVRPPAAITATHLSAEGQILGTPLFMSPEQAMGGRELDERSDIYSLGAVAYYLLTGRPPFEGRGAIEVIIAHARDAVTPPSRVRAAVPDDLERVVLRCLAKDPADRFQDAEDLERALGECASAAGWDQGRAARWWRDPERFPPPAPTTA